MPDQYIVRTDFWKGEEEVERKEEVVELGFPSSVLLVTPPSSSSVTTAVCCRDLGLFLLSESCPVLKRRTEE